MGSTMLAVALTAAMTAATGALMKGSYLKTVY